MQVSIVIPNYNGKELLQRNLPQVINSASNSEIIVVDDGSTDGSSTFLKQHFPKIKLIEKVTNSGFSTTVNLGVKAAQNAVVVLLNTDVVPQTDFIPGLLKSFRDPQIFAVGFIDLSQEGVETVKRGRGIGKFSRGLFVHARGNVNNSNTLWASGGSSAFRKRIWEDLGGLDELYDPFYWEDIDLSYRALKKGYQILFNADIVVRHAHEEGSINKLYSKNEIQTIAYRNQFIFIWKNITDRKFILQHTLWMPIHLMKALVKGDFCMIKGFLWALSMYASIMRHRNLHNLNVVLTDPELLKKYDE